MRQPNHLRYAGTVDGEEVFKGPRRIYGKRFGTVFPDALPLLFQRLRKSEILVLITIWQTVQRGNICLTSIAELESRLVNNGSALKPNHISTHIKALERAGALKVVSSRKGEIEIELNRDYYWNGSAGEYHQKAEQKKHSRVIKHNPRSRKRKEPPKFDNSSIAIEEVYNDNDIIVRYTNPITSMQTAYIDMLNHLFTKGGYSIPKTANGRRDRGKIDFYVAQNLAALGMSMAEVRHALLIGSEKAQHKYTKDTNYVWRTVEYAFESLEL